VADVVNTRAENNPMPDKPTINLAEYYDADTLRGFTPEQYETRKRLYAERCDAKEAAESEYNRARSSPLHNPTFNDVIKRWPTLEPLVRKYLDLDHEIERIDREELPQEEER